MAAGRAVRPSVVGVARVVRVIKADVHEVSVVKNGALIEVILPCVRGVLVARLGVVAHKQVRARRCVVAHWRNPAHALQTHQVTVVAEAALALVWAFVHPRPPVCNRRPALQCTAHLRRARCRCSACVLCARQHAMCTRARVAVVRPHVASTPAVRHHLIRARKRARRTTRSTRQVARGQHSTHPTQTHQIPVVADAPVAATWALVTSAPTMWHTRPTCKPAPQGMRRGTVLCHHCGTERRKTQQGCLHCVVCLGVWGGYLLWRVMVNKTNGASTQQKVEMETETRRLQTGMEGGKRCISKKKGDNKIHFSTFKF